MLRFFSILALLILLPLHAAEPLRIGMIGLDRQVDTADAALSYVSRADIGGIVFEAEPARGAKQ